MSRGLIDFIKLREFSLPQLGFAQPQCDMRWLQRLFNHRQQLLAQSIQIDLITQRCAENSKSASGVILATIEAAFPDGITAVRPYIYLSNTSRAIYSGRARTSS